MHSAHETIERRIVTSVTVVCGGNHPFKEHSEHSFYWLPDFLPSYWSIPFFSLVQSPLPRQMIFCCQMRLQSLFKRIICDPTVTQKCAVTIPPWDGILHNGKWITQCCCKILQCQRGTFGYLIFN